MDVKWLGVQVWDRRRRMKGIVIEELKNPMVKKVRCWNPDEGRYCEYNMNKTFLEIVWQTKEVMNQTNLDDPNFWTYYEPAALEAALMSNDEEWFNEIKEACDFLENF